MTITSANSAADIFQSLNGPASTAKESSSSNRTIEDMGSQEFLTLMIAQLKNQDPTKPMDQMAFMSQLAQFGTVSGVQELNAAFDGVASTLTGQQALQASQLVGRSVSTGSNAGSLSQIGYRDNGDPAYALRATVDMGNGANGGTFYVQDVAGRLVFQGQLPAGSGSVPVLWDGVDAQGNQLPPGQYRISAEISSGGQQKPAAVYAHEPVISVGIGAGNQVTLNLANGQTLGINEVKEFY